MTAKERPKENGQETALVLLDRLDDDLIVAELQGRAISTWAYKFTQDGQEITGLSIAGVEQAARETGRHGEAIRVLKHDWRETDEAYYATVEAGRFYLSADGREVLVDSAIGAKREQKQKWGTTRGKWYTDKFAFEKAISKAARNAKGKLLDDKLKAEVIAMALKEGRYRQVQPPEQKAAARAQVKEQAPPPQATVNTETAHRRFFATAGEMQLRTQAQVHAWLGFLCAGKPEDHMDGDPKACHLLRDSVQQLGGNAAAWDEMTKRLKDGPHTPFSKPEQHERQQEPWV